MFVLRPLLDLNDLGDLQRLRAQAQCFSLQQVPRVRATEVFKAEGRLAILLPRAVGLAEECDNCSREKIRKLKASLRYYHKEFCRLRDEDNSLKSKCDTNGSRVSLNPSLMRQAPEVLFSRATSNGRPRFVNKRPELWLAREKAALDGSVAKRRTAGNGEKPPLLRKSQFALKLSLKKRECLPEKKSLG